MTSCSALDQFCFLQEEQQHVHQTTFSHDPLKIFAHSSTTHNRFLHILPHHTTDFCASFTFFHNPQENLQFLPQPTKFFALSSKIHNSFGHFLHILPQLTKIFVLSSTTHNRFLQILPQNTKYFCCLLRLLLHHTNSIQFHFIPFKQKKQNFELGYQICVQSRTKLRIGSPNLCTVSNKTLNRVPKSVGNLQTKLRIGLPNLCAIFKQNFELGCQI